MMQLFRNPLYSAVTLGHFTLDVFNSSGPILVTFLSVPMALSAAQIGVAIGAYQLFSALTQPLFGWIDDKIGSRWLGPGSVAWTIGFLVFSIMVAHQTNNFRLFIIPFILASMGSSAFHPLGTKHASEAGTDKAATGTAIFFLFGQAGLASGPVLAGVILGNIGVSGIYILALLASPMILFMAYAMRHTYPESTHLAATSGLDATIVKKTVRWGAIGLLALVIGFRSWTTIGTVTFLPKMFQDMGWTPPAYGSITGAYWLASALTGVVAGYLADRWGRRQVVSATLLAGSISLYFLPLYDSFLVAFPLVIITGGMLGASHSILVVIAQALLPGRKSFTSGVTLGYLFGTGAIAAWGIGHLADVWGLTPVIQAGAAVSILGAVLAFALPSTKQSERREMDMAVPAQSAEAKPRSPVA
jgi:FSR family fosmidomycin resistance protein-like MFS transporter